MCYLITGKKLFRSQNHIVLLPDVCVLVCDMWYLCAWVIGGFDKTLWLAEVPVLEHNKLVCRSQHCL